MPSDESAQMNFVLLTNDIEGYILRGEKVLLGMLKIYRTKVLIDF